QREIEARIEAHRAQHTEALDRQNAIQAEYYAVGNEVSRLEQAIEHARETRDALKREQEQLNRAWAEAEAHLGADRAQLMALEQRLSEIAPQLQTHTSELEAALAALREGEAAMQAWQTEWEAESRAAAEPAKAREIQSARIEQLESHVAHLRERQARLSEEAATLEAELKAAGLEAAREAARELDQACAAIEAELAQNAQHVQDARARRESADHALTGRRGEQQSAEARLASLHELKAAAEARHDTGIAEWLRGRGLEQAPRLASRLQVEPGWETAVERVLGARLAAVCAERFVDATRELADLKPAHLTLLDTAVSAAGAASPGSLAEKIRSDVDVTPLLAAVQTAATLEEALARRDALANHESIITPDGAWIGRNWLSLEYAAGNQRGWLAREREIETIERECAERRAEIERLAAELGDGEIEIAGLERRREELTRRLNERNRERAERREQLGHEQERLHQIETRNAQVA